VLQTFRNRLLLKIWRLKYRDYWYRSQISRVMSLGAREKRDRGIKQTVRLIANFPGLWQRTIEQTPNGSCQWGETLFVAEGEADHYMILNSSFDSSGNDLFSDFKWPRPDRVWGIHMEPEEYVRLLRYDRPEEHSRVSRFYTNCEYLLESGGVYRPSPPYVHFLTGKTWDFLSSARPAPKRATLGVVASNLADLEGHRRRQQFLERLDASGIDCEIWGRGESLRRFRNYRGFALNKWDVHANCRYSIVIENSVSPLYWTEKVADALLGYSLPLYHGCTGLADYLPAKSYIPIDINDQDCIDQIRSVLINDPYADRLSAIESARRTLLSGQNLYAFVDRELRSS